MFMMSVCPFFQYYAKEVPYLNFKAKVIHARSHSLEYLYTLDIIARSINLSVITTSVKGRSKLSYVNTLFYMMFWFSDPPRNNVL